MDYGAYRDFQQYFISYRGGRFHWWNKPKYPEKTTDLSQLIDKRIHIIVNSYLDNNVATIQVYIYI
jgi:hypothetical protein